MKSLFRMALLALVLLLVALVSALTAMRLAIHGREVAMPNLVGKTPSEARRAAEENGLQLEVERQYYSSVVPEGRVLSQVPAAGTLVRRGWRAHVAESLGPQRVEIPDVVGQSERAAEFNIRRRGLDVGTLARLPLNGRASDQVIAQSPAANANNVSAPKISLLVADTPQPQAFVMPNLTGQPLSSVLPALQNAGLRLGVLTMAGQAGNPFSAPTMVTPQAAAQASVVAQTPPAGQKILSGSAVNLEVR
jgi:eukaryotic-like serine/threonine-protein kinase